MVPPSNHLEVSGKYWETDAVVDVPLGTLITNGSSTVSVTIPFKSRLPNQEFRLSSKSCGCVGVPKSVVAKKNFNVEVSLTPNSITQFHHFARFQSNNDQECVLKFSGQILPAVIPVEVSSSGRTYIPAGSRSFRIHFDSNMQTEVVSNNGIGFILANPDLVSADDLRLISDSPNYALLKQPTIKTLVGNRTFDMLPVKIQSNRVEFKDLEESATFTAAWPQGNSQVSVDLVTGNRIRAYPNSVFINNSCHLEPSPECFIELSSDMPFLVSDVIFDKEMIEVIPATREKDTLPRNKRSFVVKGCETAKQGLIRTKIEFLTNHPRCSNKVVDIYVNTVK